MASNITNPLRGAGIAVDVVAAAVGGGRVVAVACQSLKCHSVDLCAPTPQEVVRLLVCGRHPVSMTRSGMDERLWRGTFKIRRSRMKTLCTGIGLKSGV